MGDFPAFHVYLSDMHQWQAPTWKDDAKERRVEAMEI